MSLSGNKAGTLTTVLAEPRLFSVLGSTPLLGRTLVASDAEPGLDRVTVISYGLWRSLFGGDPRAVGRTIRLGGRSYSIVGVMRRDFFFPQERGWQGGCLCRGSGRLWRCGIVPQLHAVARLRRGVTAERAQAEANLITQRLNRSYPGTRVEIGVFRLYNVLTAKYRAALWAMLAAVGVLLALACANLANLLLSEGDSRSKEFAIRASLGASPGGIFLQLLTESLLLAMLGGFAGLLVGHWAIALVREFHFVGIPRLENAGLDAKALLFALAVSLVAGLLFGTVPAWSASRADLLSVLQRGVASSARMGGRQFQRLLVVFEVAFALPLVMAAGLLVNSFVRLSRIRWGFRPDHLLVADTTLLPPFDQERGFTEDVLRRLRNIPGVLYASMSYGLPLKPGAFDITPITVDGRVLWMQDWFYGTWRVAPDYFRTMGISLIRGCEFTDVDATSQARSAIISEALAQELWPGQDPVGKRLSFMQPTKRMLALLHKGNFSQANAIASRDPKAWEVGPTWEVVGEVGNVRMFGVDSESAFPGLPRPLRGLSCPGWTREPGADVRDTRGGRSCRAGLASEKCDFGGWKGGSFN